MLPHVSTDQRPTGDYRADFVFHGHFYQPPRENPWTDEVDREPSARPFHDWNARIDHECYAANATSRIHDSKDRLAKLVNNYEWISFNFGPTLLRWLEKHDPATLARIVEADRRSAKRRGGHGNAIAQTYNHIILALADDEDVRVQVRWALREFEARFGRPAEGLWLSETAADRRVLDILVEEGLRFAILAPVQAGRVRAPGGGWEDVRGARVDPSRPYLHRHRTKPGQALSLFFYDGPLAQAVSFGDALRDGRNLARHIESAYNPDRNHPQIVHLAVDGETAGHHQGFGNLALAWALDREVEARGFRITNYGEYLDRHPATWEAELDEGPYGEGTSWSCAHGVSRWIRDCGCRIDPGAPTQQAWRTPLREALDLLRDGAKAYFRREAKGLFYEPEKAVDDYIELLLHIGDHRLREEWLAERVAPPIDEERRRRALSLLELRHQLLLMYTSCGWFFDDVGGLETVQILRYAGRALELWEELGAEVPRAHFLQILAGARSNDPGRGSGADIFRRDALVARVTPERIAAHLAMTAVATAPTEEGVLGLHSFRRLRFHLHESEEASLVTSRFELEHRRTGRRTSLRVAMLHTGALEFLTTVAPAEESTFEVWQRGLHEALHSEGVDAVRAALRDTSGARVFGAEDLLEADRQRLFEKVFQQVIQGFSRAYDELYSENTELIAALHGMGMELPEELRAAATFSLRRRFESELRDVADDVDEGALSRALELVREAARRDVSLDSRLACATLEGILERHLEELQSRDPHNGDLRAAVAKIVGLLDTSAQLHLHLQLGEAQLVFHDRFLDRRSGALEAPLVDLGRRLGFSEEALSG